MIRYLLDNLRRWLARKLPAWYYEWRNEWLLDHGR